MRNKTVRMKRLRAERVVDEYMRMPARIVLPMDYSETNLKELRESRLWAVPEAGDRQVV